MDEQTFNNHLIKKYKHNKAMVGLKRDTCQMIDTGTESTQSTF